MSGIFEVISLVKLTQQQRKEIVLSHYLDSSKENIEYLMDKYNMSKQGLYNVINHKDSKNYIQEYSPTLTKKMDKVIDLCIDKIIEAIEEGRATPKDIITTFGIVYDKSRMEKNLSTSNQSININIKIDK